MFACEFMGVGVTQVKIHFQDINIDNAYNYIYFATIIGTDYN